MSKPPSHPLTYRLWILRRMIVVVLALPLCAVLLLSLATGGEALLSHAAYAVPILLIWSTLLLAMLLRFPHGLGDALNQSLAFTALILLTPAAEWLAAQAKGPLTTGHYLAMGFLLLVVWIGLLLVIETIIARLATHGRKRMFRYKLRLWSDLPPERVMAILRPLPEQTTATQRTGPMDSRGRIPVWLKRSSLVPEGSRAAPFPTGPDYWEQVLEETALTLGILVSTRDGETETMHFELHPHSGGTMIHRSAATDVLNPAQVLFFSLGDMGRDILLARLDSAEDRKPPRALHLLPADTIALWFNRAIPPDDKPLF